jgi:DHA2 family multidrug resistance protein
LLSIFPPQKKTIALTIWSGTTLIAPICGPILGGYLSDNWSWPWIFWINLPVGLFSAYICWRGLRRHETPTRRLPIDVVGLSLLVIWVGTLQIMLDTGKDHDWFESTLICSEALVAVIGFVAFLIWELSEKHPIIDLSLFRRRNFSFGLIPYVLGYATFFSVIVLQPLWMQTWLGFTASWAGLIAAPAGLVAVFLSPVIGKSLARIDARWIASVSLAAFGASYLLRSQLTLDSSVIMFVIPSLVQGIGMAGFFVSVLSIVIDGLEPQRVPAASGLSNFLRILGGALATSIVTTLWDRRATFHQSRLAEATSIYDPRAQQALEALHNSGLNDQQSLGVLTHSLNSQAYFLSVIDNFWICGWITFAIIAAVWLARRPQGAAPAAAAE